MAKKKPEVGNNGPLTQNDAALADNSIIADFLKDKFAVGYLTHAFSKSNDDLIKEQFKQIPDHGEKLNYFWKGSGDSCFSKERGYNLATAALLDSTFASSVQGLAPYLSDQPELWAQKLYDYCTKPFTLNGLALQNTLDGRKRLTHLCTLLHALDQQARIATDDGKKVTYATALYGKVMDVRLNFVIARFTSDNKEEGVAFLTEYFTQYFNSLLAGGKWQDEVLKAAKGDLDAMMADLQADNVNQLVLNMGEIISDAMEILVRFKDLPLPARINRWAKSNSRITTAIGRTMTIGIYGLGIFSSIQAFMGWNQLKPEQKALAVIEVVDLSANIFSDIVSFTAAAKIANAETAVGELVEAVGELSSAVNAESISVSAGRILIQFDDVMLDMSAPQLAQAGFAAGEALTAAEDLEETAVKWMSFSKVASGFAQGMTILALGAACVCTGFQIANDFATGQPPVIKALDIIEMVSNAVAFLVETGIGIAALAGAEVCSAIPVIGVVAAVIGILVAIISMFIHRNPPPTPEETFVTEHSVPFLNGILSPPAAWLAAQKKIEEHLSGGPNTNANTAVFA